MATFIRLTAGGGKVWRMNVDHLAQYIGHSNGGSTIYMSGATEDGPGDDVQETPEQIDALIAAATAPTFRCRSCGLTRTEATDGAGICADCYSRDL